MNPNYISKRFLLWSINLSRFVVPQRTEFSSTYNLKNIYPQSSLKLSTPDETKITEESQNFSGHIPLDKVKFKFSLSSGPGGQHLQKTHTKVELRVQLSKADWLPEKLRERLLEIKKNQLTKEGYLIIKSDKTRSQHLNKADVLQRLRCIIYHAEEELTPAEPDPESIERNRRRQEQANRERLRSKHLNSLLKESRRNTD